jgi:hypothetical protein
VNDTLRPVRLGDEMVPLEADVRLAESLPFDANLERSMPKRLAPQSQWRKLAASSPG